jgi:hypothetical protein
MRKIPFNTSISTKDKAFKRKKEKPLELIEEVEEKK